MKKPFLVASWLDKLFMLVLNLLVVLKQAHSYLLQPKVITRSATQLNQTPVINRSQTPDTALGLQIEIENSPFKMNPTKKKLAKIVKATEDTISEAGDRLRAGKLVAFPTETVFGLGASCWDREALLGIFRAKQRPLSDPLIAHVPDLDAAMTVLDSSAVSGAMEEAVSALTSAFWPGPLTLVLPAHRDLPAEVSAGTGWVGVRCPNHPVALRLLRAAGVPVCAPSANRFGHVSPTRPHHVLQDLGHSDILILDPATTGEEDDSTTCTVGIESTVARVDAARGKVEVLRRGAVGEGQIRAALGPLGDKFCVSTPPPQHHQHHTGGAKGGNSEEKEDCTGGQDEATLSPVAVESGVPESSGDTNLSKTPGFVCPGQLLKHYAPDVPTFQVRACPENQAPREGVAADLPSHRLPGLDRCVVIDFHGRLRRSLQGDTQHQPCPPLGYRDLSSTGKVDEAAAALFDALRWSESVHGAQAVLIAEVASLPERKRLKTTENGAGPALLSEPSANETEVEELAAAVNDRIYRAAEGKSLSCLPESMFVKAK